MKRNIILVILPILGFLPLFGASQRSDCESIKAIIATMSTWKKKQAELPASVQGPPRMHMMHHPMLLGFNRLYYANLSKLTHEVKSEWGIDDDGKCSYTSYLGPYPADSIDAKGATLRRQWLGCIQRSDWTISAEKKAYLFMSYNSVDVIVEIMKVQADKPGEYWLNIYLFRFTPIF